ncbi:hypothetical protein QCA50_000534 [Cerrena zonata]|uniref:Uncharacterized protein n=1 Tax=Cerrena zonata TaxID=2478898 RepID=A0AAW0GRN4_9APHY
MNYTPRYSQPFTLEQARLLDVPIIVEEIYRLQNSLKLLGATQQELKEAIAESPDPEFSQALEENDQTIGSQQERVSMLKMVLTEKGIPTGPLNFDPEPSSNQSHVNDQSIPRETDDGGIDL